MDLKRLNWTDENFQQQLTQLLSRDQAVVQQVEQRVDDIIAQVRADGDAALMSLTATLDQNELANARQLRVPPSQLKQAYEQLAPHLRDTLEQCAKRIDAYHQYQLQSDWTFEDAVGNRLGQRVTPLDRVGLYVPGGKAAYPSSVLMNAIPARVAGVNELVVVVPAPQGELNPLVLAAAHIVGIEEVYQVGGAQAVAALAYGTKTIAPVDKIVGPGNQYVATAKKRVFGQVGIDMVAGPSEVLVVADATVDPKWVALDLFAQAEHDELAQSILISADINVLSAVSEAIDTLLPEQPRREIIETALQDVGALIQVPSLEQAFECVNRIAPEHLEVMVDTPEQWLPRIRHAGAIFLGQHSAESLGDYCLGPSHVLPTSGSARFSSPLGVYDFQKKSSVIHCSAKGAKAVAPLAETLAEAERLTAHAASAACRSQE